jgi:mRNA-degrading endonuclease RelE of RelBE toxin-antitoxin system
MRLMFKKSAMRELLKLQKGQPAKASDIWEAIARIAAAPSAANNNIKPLKGIEGGYRVRAGDWRVSYLLDRRADVLEVFEIAPRGGAYR